MTFFSKIFLAIICFWSTIGLLVYIPPTKLRSFLGGTCALKVTSFSMCGFLVGQIFIPKRPQKKLGKGENKYTKDAPKSRRTGYTDPWKSFNYWAGNGRIFRYRLVMASIGTIWYRYFCCKVWITVD